MVARSFQAATLGRERYHAIGQPKNTMCEMSVTITTPTDNGWAVCDRTSTICITTIPSSDIVKGLYIYVCRTHNTYINPRPIRESIRVPSLAEGLILSAFQRVSRRETSYGRSVLADNVMKPASDLTLRGH
jgi:hypothetical protein